MKLEPGSNNNNFITATGRKNNKAKAKREFCCDLLHMFMKLGNFLVL